MTTDDRGVKRNRRTAAVVSLFLIAAAVTVYFTFYYPPAPREEGAGTIGAVKKYRVQQISENDIVLAGQQAQTGVARPEEFLDDSAKLRNLSLGMKDLAAKLQSRENEELGKKAKNFTTEIGSLIQLVESQSSVLQKRMQGMSEVAEYMSKQLEARSSDTELANMRSDLAELSSKLANAAQLDAKMIANMADRLESHINAFESRKLNMFSLENVESELGSFRQELESKAQLESQRLGQMSSRLESYSAMFENRSQFNNVSLENNRGYLQAMALEARALASAEAELGSMQKLASRAGVENQAMDNLQGRLHSASEALAGNAMQIENKALYAMKGQLESFVLGQKGFGHMQSAALEMGKSIESRTGAELEARSELKAKLARFTTALESASHAYGARSASMLQNQLAACAGFMESRKLASQVMENMGGYMAEARESLKSFALEQQLQQKLESKLGSLNSRMENAAGSLESRQAK